MKRLLCMLFGLGLVLAGCGEGDVSDSTVVITVEDPEVVNPAAMVQAAVKVSEEATSFRGEYVLRITGFPFAGDIVQPVSVALATNGDSSITMYLADVFVLEDEEEDTSDPYDSALRIRYVDNRLYVSLPKYRRSAISDSPWVSLDASQLTAEEIEGYTNYDQDSLLDFLLGIDDQAIVNRDQKINGVSATRIVGVSTLREVFDALSEEEQQDLLESMQLDLSRSEDEGSNQIEAMEKLSIDIEVWIDQDGYIVREAVVIDEWYDFLASIDPTAKENREMIEGLAFSFELDFYDFGAPISIPAPPEEDVTPFEGSLDDLLS